MLAIQWSTVFSPVNCTISISGYNHDGQFGTFFRTTASMLKSPPPYAAMKRYMNEYSAAGMPPFCTGHAP